MHARRKPARVGRRGQRSARALAVVLVLAIGVVGTTRAFLADDATVTTIDVRGLTIDPPTGLTAAEDGLGGVALGWTPPASNETPTGYEVHRRTSGASWPPTPIATLTHPTASWTDASVLTCTSYLYRVRAVHQGIPSDPTSQVAVTPGDTQRPTIVRSRIAGTSGIPDVADFIKPGGEFYAFVEVSDSCSGPEGIGVELTLANLGPAGTHAAQFGTWMAGGTAYNFRAGPFTSSAGLGDGAQPSWTISASDDGGSRSGTGQVATVDAIGPVATRAPQVVSAATNFFSTTYGRGEVRPGSSAFAYAHYTDARSGVPTQDEAVVVDASSIGGPANAVLPAGSFATDNGVTDWTRRSATTAIGSPAIGTATVTVTAQDAVGNSTATAVAVDIDDAGPVLSSCAAVNGSQANRLRQADTTNLTFDDTIDPGSVAASWTGTGAFTFDAVVRNGTATNDFFTYSGVNLLAGATAPTAFDLGSASWVTADRTFAGSQLTLAAPTQLVVEYRGGSNTNVQAASGSFRPSSAITDAAGNAILTSSLACSTAW